MALALLTHYFCIFLVGSAETDRRRVFFHLTCGLLLGIFGAIEMARKTPPLELSRSQILRFRRRVGSLDERLPAGTKSLRRAAWAGLQDSMPRAALLSIHARMEGADSTSWGAPVPRPALGSAIQRLRRGRRGPPSILPWAATGGRAAPRKGARHRCPPARVSRRQADAVWPSRARDGRVAQQPAIRGADGHGSSALGWIASACRLDGTAAGHGPVAGASRARSPLPSRLRSDNARDVRRLGRNRKSRGERGVPRARGFADAGAHAGWRRLDPLR